MYTYRWLGIDQRGHQHIGFIVAQSSAAVRTQLGARRIALLSCVVSWRTLLSKSFWQTFILLSSPRKRIAQQDYGRVCRALASLLHAGMPLPAALRMVATSESSHNAMLLLESWHMSVVRGERLSAAMGRGFVSIPSYLRTAVAATEGTGRLAESLSALGAVLEVHEQYQQKLHRALLVPALTFGVAVVMVIVLGVVVIPSMQAWLPEAMGTQVAQLSIGLQRFGWGIGAFMVGSMCVWLLSHVWSRGAYLISMLLFHLPVVGPLVSAKHTWLFLEIAGVLCGAGVVWQQALADSATVCMQPYWRVQFSMLFDRIAAGESVAQAVLGLNPICGKAVVTLLQRGEHTGHWPAVMRHAAEMIASSFSHRLSVVVRVLPVLTLVLIGSGIAVFLFHVYAPLLSAAGSLGGAF